MVDEVLRWNVSVKYKRSSLASLFSKAQTKMKRVLSRGLSSHKLLGTSASLLVTSALLVVTRSY